MRNLGSAATLVGDQRILFIFVNDNGASPWTYEFRRSVEIHATRSLRWLENLAALNSKSLHFKCAFAPTGASVGCEAGCLIDENDYCAGPGHSTWQNAVITGLVGWGTVAQRWNELFNQYGLPLVYADGAALFFVVRRCVPSIAFPYQEGEHDEFRMERGIIYDFGGIIEGQQHLDSHIAHEILHLYGAVDLNPKKSPHGLYRYASQDYNEVMHTPTQHEIDGYHISKLTAYLVGWQDCNPLVDDRQKDGEVSRPVS